MPSDFKKILITGLVIGLSVVLPTSAFAQIDLNIPFALSSELGVEIVPNYPRPNEMTYVSLALYTDDLNSADITWYRNGKSVLSGKGETRYSFKNGKIGEETKIEIRIRLLNGASFSKTFTLNPASIDLVWEANSYVPPFYQGKALHARQGSLKIVAMPEFVKNGKRIPPQNLIYEWGNGVDAYQSQSGYGKNTIIINGSLLGKIEKVEVLVRDPVNNLVADAFIDIAPSDPQILFYENNPYYGHNFDQALNNFELKTAEVQILAAPYYFSKERAGNLTYDWQLNGFSVPGLSNSRTAIFKKPEGSGGQSNISLNIENLNRILQQADSNLTMQFEE